MVYDAQRPTNGAGTRSSDAVHHGGTLPTDHRGYPQAVRRKASSRTSRVGAGMERNHECNPQVGVYARG